jgi:hypothetical protein
MTQKTPHAFLLPANEAVELHDFLLTLPMMHVRKHVQRIEALKPLFEESDGSPEGAQNDD